MANSRIFTMENSPWGMVVIVGLSQGDDRHTCEVSPLYGTMETHEQDSVLKAREGWRKAWDILLGIRSEC